MMWRRVNWSKRAYETLKPAFNGDDAVIIEEIEQGNCQLFECQNGFMVVRSEGDELVLVAGAGRDVDSALNDWVQIAKGSGFKSVRYHTKRKGMMKKALSNGFSELERVYRLEL